MHVTIKGQVTIPKHIREKLGITATSEVEFIEEGDKVYIVKKKQAKAARKRFASLRGSASVKMSTDEIMALTRQEP